MHRTADRRTIAWVVGIAVSMVGIQPLIAQQAPVTRTMLQQKELEGVAGKELIMYRADFIPGGVAGRHTHPGPELVYVMEGTFVLEIDGQPPLTLKAGESVHVPAKQIHNAKNGSATEAAKVLVFLVGEKGQPLATLVQ